MKNKGYNLIEILVAISLLTWIVLVIAGLFLYGQKGIYSGKQQTKAVRLAQSIYEDVMSLDKDNKYKIFGATENGTAQVTTQYQIPVNDPHYNPFNKSENPVLYDVFEKWKDMLKDISADAYILCTLKPSNPDGSTATFRDCRFTTYNLSINWQEVKRHRKVEFFFAVGGF